MRTGPTSATVDIQDTDRPLPTASIGDVVYSSTLTFSAGTTTLLQNVTERKGEKRKR